MPVRCQAAPYTVDWQALQESNPKLQRLECCEISQSEPMFGGSSRGRTDGLLNTIVELL